MRKLLWLSVLAGALIAAPSWAQDDNPYGDAPPRPTAPPAPRPPGPPPGTRAAPPPAAHQPAPPPATHQPAPPPATHEAPPPEPIRAPGEQPTEVPLPATGRPEHGEPGGAVPRPVEPAPPPAEEHAGAGHEPGVAEEHGAHGAGEHGESHEGAAHGEGAHGGHSAHNAPPHEMNWFYGFIGTDEKAEPNVFWRKPDMPPPFLANLINFALFAYVIVRFGKKPLQEALSSRKKAIMQDIDAATKMKDEASKRLAQYEDRLKHIDQEIERIKKDFREQGERDKERILAEAKEKRERMLKDAQFLIEQEAKQLRIDLVRETVEAAVQAAETILVQKVTSSDHDRVAEEFLKEVASSRGLGVSKGGSA